MLAPEQSSLESLVALLQTWCRQEGSRVAVGPALHTLIEAGLDQLPLPGQGRTLQRWRGLAAVAAYDLSLAKLYEGHTDALAILAELNATHLAPKGSSWGVWCAEPPGARVLCQQSEQTGKARLSGTKCWCSGAATLSHALVSAWNVQNEPCLVAVTLHQDGVTITQHGWHAVGMADTASVDVLFEGAQGVVVGLPGDYVNRPGFWHGGAGIASCWYGAAAKLGDALRAACLAKPGQIDAHQLAHVGQVDTALASARTLLHEVASWIDQHPNNDARTQALRARLVVEACATQCLGHVSRALGAGPLCRNDHIARVAADLPVFLRQSHAERDLANLGQAVLTLPPASPWQL